MSVHEDTLQGLKEALEYVRGDKTKARSVTITPDETDDYETDQILFQKITQLSPPNKRRAIQYVEELLRA